jgi:hypothetical protein
MIKWKIMHTYHGDRDLERRMDVVEALRFIAINKSIRTSQIEPSIEVKSTHDWLVLLEESEWYDPMANT